METPVLLSRAQLPYSGFYRSIQIVRNFPYRIVLKIMGRGEARQSKATLRLHARQQTVLSD
jgi:hypothetical protein